MTHGPRSAALAVVAIALTACSAATSPPPLASTTTAPLTTPIGGDASAPPASAPVASEVPALEAWRTAELTDVRSGDAFSIADLSGSLVVIEPMAIWCSNCAAQQREARAALAAMAGEDIVYISLDIDPSENAKDLAAYAEDRGFDWRFVVAGRDVSRVFAQAFGDQVLSPPSTPSIIIRPDGELVGPTFGIRDAEALQDELESHLS